MILYQPYTKTEGDKVKILADFEINGKIDTLWYEVDKEYEPYLVTEQCDAFLVGLVLLGMKLNEDIYVEGNISKRLFYGLTSFVIPSIYESNTSYNQIQIYFDKLVDDNLSLVKKNATGISCGIDSFSTYLYNKLKGGKIAIDCFTFFNAGSNGDLGGENARSVFKNRLNLVSEFANEEGKKIVAIDTNLSELLNMNFAKTASIRNISCVLILQKIFSDYFYSSSFKYTDFHLSNSFMAYYDLILLHGLNTETTQFFSTMTHLSREERTNIVGENSKITSKHLDVCTNPNLDGKLNCSKCYKCMITQLTLELGGQLDSFHHVFDKRVYLLNKDKFISQILFKKDKSIMYKNLHLYLIEKEFKFKWYHYYLRYVHYFKYYFKIFKKLLKNYNIIWLN